jgi:branched-chain amino acid transport system substrate-binding protein
MAARLTRREFGKRFGWAAGGLLGAASAADVLAACGAPGSETQSSGSGGLTDKVKIGMITTVTGKAADEGDLAVKAAQLAVEEINGKGGIGGKAKIDLQIQDSQSSDQGAVSAFRKSVDQDAVDLLLGPIKSTQVLAMMDQIKEAQIPTMVGGTNVTLTQKGVKWLFRMRPHDGIAAPAMVTYINEDLKRTRVAVLHDSDAFGTGGADLVEKTLKDKGLTLARRERYVGGDKDFTAQLTNIKNASPDVMVLYGTNASDDGVILRQFRQLGLPFQLMGSPSTGVTVVYDLAREAQDGILAVVDYAPQASQVARDYASAYRKKYNQEPDDQAAWTYDSVYVMARAVETARTVDKAKVRDAIAGIKGLQRVIGKVSFDDVGNGLHSVSVVKMQGGKKQLQKLISV